MGYEGIMQQGISAERMKFNYKLLEATVKLFVCNIRVFTHMGM